LPEQAGFRCSCRADRTPDGVPDQEEAVPETSTLSLTRTRRGGARAVAVALAAAFAAAVLASSGQANLTLDAHSASHAPKGPAGVAGWDGIVR
jgi:hypothetical protein